MIGELVKQDTLLSLDLSWNNMKGEPAKQFAGCLEGLWMFNFLDLSQNLLGTSHDNEEPAIYAFIEVLNRLAYLTEANFGYNLVSEEAAFMIANVLRMNWSLKKFSINGNPIGKEGVSFILAATKDNKETQVDININDTQTSDMVEHVPKMVIFDHSNIERDYKLLLDRSSHRLILQFLLDMDEKQFLSNKQIDETSQRGQCL